MRNTTNEGTHKSIGIGESMAQEAGERGDVVRWADALLNSSMGDLLHVCV